jgi:hypothetical protein
MGSSDVGLFFVPMLASCGSLRAEDPHGTEPRCNGRAGSEVGDQFVGFSFRSCDDTVSITQESIPPRQPYLFNVSTGWCTSCREETPNFQTFYAAHTDDVSIVQLLHEDSSTRPPTADFCREWQLSFGDPLTYTLLIDPDGDAATYFLDANPSTSMPLNLVVDAAGCVAGRWIGLPAGGEEPLRTLESVL